MRALAGTEHYDILAMAERDDAEWKRNRRMFGRELRQLLGRPAALVARLNAVVREARVAVKPPEWGGSLPQPAGQQAAT